MEYDFTNEVRFVGNEFDIKEINGQISGKSHCIINDFFPSEDFGSEEYELEDLGGKTLIYDSDLGPIVMLEAGRFELVWTFTSEAPINCALDWDISFRYQDVRFFYTMVERETGERNVYEIN